MEQLHFEYIIWNIIYAYYCFANDYIDTDTLKKVFNIFLKKFNLMEKTNYKFNYDKLFNEFIENYNINIVNNLIEVDFNKLFSIIENNVQASLEDVKIEHYIPDSDIYEAMDIPIPLDRTEEYFDLNKKIMQLYDQIIYLEQNTIDFPIAKIYLAKTIDILKRKFDNISEEEVSDLNLSLSKYNECLIKSPVYYLNFEWYQTLFGDEQTAQEMLSYSHVANYYNATCNYSDIDLLLKVWDCFSQFLFFFIVDLDKQIKKENDYYTKCILIEKFYHLLAGKALYIAEVYYLNHNNSLEGLDNIFRTEKRDELFLCVTPIVMECLNRINYTDEEIFKDATLTSKITLNALFIKCFLDQTIEEDKDRIKVLNSLKNSVIETEEQYKTARELVNNIIFDNSPNLKLSKN